MNKENENMSLDKFNETVSSQENIDKYYEEADKMKYYSLNTVMSRGADMSFVIGGRGVGKTYSFLEYCVKDYLKNGNEFVYVRRSDDEIKYAKHTLFNPLLEKYNVEVRARGFICEIREAAPADISDDEKKKWNSNTEWKRFGYFIPVSEQQNFKSSSFPKVNKVCYDEFIIENSRKFYVPDEVNQFLSLVSTIARSRKIKVFLLSNSGFISNPFFDYYDVRGFDFNDSEFVRRENGRVIFQYYNDRETTEKLLNTTTAKISGESYRDYAFSNKFKDANEDLVADKPTGAIPRFKLTVDGKKWLTVYTKPGENWWISAKNADVIGYTLEKWKPLDEAEYSNKIVMNLRDQLHRRKISFSSADVREKFLTWLRSDYR